MDPVIAEPGPYHYLVSREEVVSRIIAVCPHCLKKYRVDAKLIGRKTECKQCNKSFEIQSDDSADTLDLPHVKDFLADQDFDPLAPRQEGHDDPAQTHDVEERDPKPENASPVAARDWKKEIQRSKKDAPFGHIQRILLGFGVFLVLASVLANLLPLFGVLLGEGNNGRFVGLVVGLAGAGLVAASLLRFPASARIAGTASAIFVFVVFFASLVNARKLEHKVNPSQPIASENSSSIRQFNSPWIDRFPNWNGFDDMQRIPSVADRWNRHQLGSTKFSASFPGEPTSANERIRVARTNVDVDVSRASVNDFDFSLSTFKFPSPRGKTDRLMLNESEAAFGDIEFGKTIEFDGFPGKEYRITDSAKSTHGRFFLVDNQVVHIKVNGSSTMVPGVLSHEFLESLQLRLTGSRTDTRPAAFELTVEQVARDAAISNNVRQIESLVSEYIRTGGLMNFPAAYLSISAGMDSGDRRFLVHPGKLPILGVDLIVVKTGSGSLIAQMAPIYGEATDDQSIMANQGYALAGIEVNSGAWIKGVRLVFMKITPVGFDTSRSYRSQWYGTRSSVVSEKLGGDGRPVYGFWMCRTNLCKSIGLIRENN